MRRLRREAGVWVGAGIYVLSALAYLSDVVGEITGFYLLGRDWIAHELISILTLIGFLTGAVIIWRSQRRLLQRNREVEQHLRAARGEFFAMLEVQFDEWGLSEAERDIALLTVKGLSVAEIAACRNTSQGTIKSQSSAIYRKAGVRSRTQLLGILIEELLVEDRAPPAAAAPAAAPAAGSATGPAAGPAGEMRGHGRLAVR